MSRGNTKNYIGVIDMLCEGPIHGLVNGKASVYVNDIPFEDARVVGTFNETVNGTFGTPKIYYAANSTTGNVVNTTLTQNDVGKYAAIEGKKVANATLTVQALGWPASGVWSSISGTGLNSDFTTTDTGTNLKYLMLENANGVRYYTEGTHTSGTEVSLAIDVSRVNTQLLHGSTWDVTIINAVKIASVAADGVSFTAETNISTTAVLEANAVKFHIKDQRTVDTEVTQVDSQVSKVDASTVQFRRGTLDQSPIQPVNSLSGGIVITGTGGAEPLLQPSADTNPFSQATLFDINGYPEGQSYTANSGAPLVIASSGGTGPSFGLSAAQRAQIDEIGIRIQYQSLVTYDNEGGDKQNASAIYVFQIAIKATSSSNFSDYKTLFSQTGGRVTHTANTTAPVSFDHTIGLTRFKPFSDFKIRIVRLTRPLGLPVLTNGQNGGKTAADKDKFTLQAASSIAGSNLSSTIKDRLTYPFTAHAGVSFSSKQYNSLPTRSYLLQGLKVRIPSSYTPREYSADGVAKYEAYWDGDFKKDSDGTHLLYYTDNPAWVFYDIVTNNRYGAGRWMDRGFINKFALYRIAKYCDELVDDGNGGKEPRFRSNIFLAKSTDVYKVIKDMATVFIGMVYWLDGKLTPIQDVPSEPIYTFSKANVIEGSFSYETTGRKTRANQVVVTWNDPNANYEPVPLIVEDREAIVKTKRIVSEKAVAMGATSEAQALRYGRWKLWTAQNQNEIVSFRTGLQGAFIRPGDVINIQDRDRFGVDYSGVIKSINAGSSSTTITFDRALTDVSNASTFKLSTLVTEYAAFYSGTDPIRIDGNGYRVSSGGTLFNRGDRFTAKFWIPDATPDGTATFDLDPVSDIYALSTENAEKAVTNAFTVFEEANGPLNSAGDNISGGTRYNSAPLSLDWKEYSYVVTKTVTLNTDRTTASTLSNYETREAPQAGTVFALQAEDSDSVEILGSKQQFRVLSIAQSEEKNIYSISAAEYNIAKYDAVDKDYALGVTPDNAFPVIEDPDEIVPPPEILYITLDSDSTRPGEELILTWKKPQELFLNLLDTITSRDFSFIDRYEVFHNIPELDSPISTRQTSMRFDKLQDGFYTFRVRAVSRKQNYSEFVSTQFEVTDQYGTNVPRIIGGLPKGIVSNSQFEYSFDSGSSTPEAIRFINDTPAGFSVGNSLDADSNVATSLSNINVGGLGLEAHRETSGTPSWYWLMYDGGTHLGFWDQDSLETLPYYRKIPSGGWRGSEQFRAPNSGLGFSTLGTTNFTLAANSTRLKRTTAHGLTVRDIVLFENPNKLKATFISSITADTESVRVVTSSNHNLQNEDKIIFEQVGGMTSLNNQTYLVNYINATTFTLINVDTGSAIGSSDVTGSFTSGGWVRPVELQAARVMGVIDDNEVILDRSFSTAFDNELYKAEYKVDYKDDAVFGRVRWSEHSAGTNSFRVDKFLTLDPSLSVGRSGLIETSIDAIQYEKGTDGSTVTQTTTFSDIRATVTAIGFSKPEFRVTTLSSDLNRQNLVGNDFVGADTAGGFSKEFIIHDTSALGKGDGSLLEVAVEIREVNNVGINTTVKSSIVRIVDGAEGVDGKTVRLNAEDYSILYDSSGARPSHSGTVTVNGQPNEGINITATARNFTDALFRFKETGDPDFGNYVDGTTPSGTNPQTAAITFAVPSTLPTDGTRVFEVEVADKPPNYNSGTQQGTDSDGNAVLPTVQANDSISLIFVAEGAGGINLVNSNSAHAYATEANGNPITTNDTIPNSDTTLELLIGGIVGTYVGYGSDGNNLNTFTAGGFTGTLPSGSWYIASAVSSEGCFTAGKITAVTNNVVSIAPVDINTSHSSYPGDNNETITWTIKVGTKDGEVEIKTVQSLSKSLKGQAGPSMSLTNDNVSVPLDNNNVADFSNTQTEVQVFDGPTELQYTNTTPGDGEFNISISNGTGVTGGDSIPVPISGDKFASVADITGLTGNTGIRTISVSGKDAAGNALPSLSKAQTFTKVTSGTIGTRGKKSFTGYLYFQSSSSSAPSPPSNTNVTANFNTNTLSGGVIGTGSTNWNQIAPTFVAGNTNKYWYVFFSASEDGNYNADTDTFDSVDINFGTVVYQGIGFQGLVTFSGTNGTTISVEDANGVTQVLDITQIDGSKITTGSIQSINYSDNSSSNFSSAGSKFDIANGTIETPHFFSNSSGAEFKGSVTLAASSNLTIGGSQLAQVALTGVYNHLSGTPTLSTVATSGSYNDLANAPNLSTVATSGSYNDLANLPSLFSGVYNDLSGKPNLFSGNYADLNGKPTIPGDINDLNDATNLLFSGAYNDLSGRPTLPTALSDLNNDIGAITGITTGSNQYASIVSGALQLNPGNIVGASTAITAINSGSTTFAQVANNELTIVPSAIVLSTDAVTSVVDAASNSGFVTLSSNTLTLDSRNISISSLSGAGNLATQNVTDLDFVASNTTISAGRIALTTSGLIVADDNSTTTSGTSRIVLDTTGGNNAIYVYDDSSSNARVILGKIS